MINSQAFDPVFKVDPVEPTGLEPVSKQIRRKLSTCLFMY